MGEVERLADDIARCSELTRAYGEPGRPCHSIVHHQLPVEGGYRHVPEAWAGDLANARILFVSSNPSISTPERPEVGEDYPLAGFEDLAVEHPLWPRARVNDFQTKRLDQSRAMPLVNRKAQFLCRDDAYRGGDKATATKKSQSYWKNALEQASTLLGPSFDMSRDVCMTEIVHCKSKAESGVVQAAPTCADRFFHRILDLSTARLVVIVGRVARDIVVANADKWNVSNGSKWEVAGEFGQLKSETFNPASHVGLITTEHRQHVVVAVQQLSWATNRYRWIERVVGAQAKEKLVGFLRAEHPESFANRQELLKFLDLS